MRLCLTLMLQDVHSQWLSVIFSCTSLIPNKPSSNIPSVILCDFTIKLFMLLFSLQFFWSHSCCSLSSCSFRLLLSFIHSYLINLFLLFCFRTDLVFLSLQSCFRLIDSLVFYQVKSLLVQLYKHPPLWFTSLCCEICTGFYHINVRISYIVSNR